MISSSMRPVSGIDWLGDRSSSSAWDQSSCRPDLVYLQCRELDLSPVQSSAYAGDMHYVDAEPLYRVALHTLDERRREADHARLAAQLQPARTTATHVRRSLATGLRALASVLDQRSEMHWATDAQR
jgi:hypothetical protein